MNPARFRWGVLLILIGGLLLANNIGHLAWWVWADILSLWPVLLIAIGVEKIFVRSRVEFIAYLAPVALAAVVIWVAVGGWSSDKYDDYGGRGERFRVESYAGLTQVAGLIKMHDNGLNLRGTRGELISARFDGFGRPPKIDYRADGSVGRLEVSDRGRWRWVHIGDRSSRDLELSLTDSLPLRLACSGNESEMRLDCRDLKVEELTVDSRQGDIRILIGSALGRAKVQVRGDDADFHISLPQDCGLRVTSAGREIGRLLKRIGLRESGGDFMTDGYDTLSPKIDLELSPGVSQLTLDYY